MWTKRFAPVMWGEGAHERARLKAPLKRARASRALEIRLPCGARPWLHLLLPRPPPTRCPLSSLPPPPTRAALAPPRPSPPCPSRRRPPGPAGTTVVGCRYDPRDRRQALAQRPGTGRCPASVPCADRATWSTWLGTAPPVTSSIELVAEAKGRGGGVGGGGGHLFLPHRHGPAAARPPRTTRSSGPLPWLPLLARLAAACGLDCRALLAAAPVLRAPAPHLLVSARFWPSLNHKRPCFRGGRLLPGRRPPFPSTPRAPPSPRTLSAPNVHCRYDATAPLPHPPLPPSVAERPLALCEEHPPQPSTDTSTLATLQTSPACRVLSLLPRSCSPLRVFFPSPRTSSLSRLTNPHTFFPPHPPPPPSHSPPCVGTTTPARDTACACGGHVAPPFLFFPLPALPTNPSSPPPPLSTPHHPLRAVSSTTATRHCSTPCLVDVSCCCMLRSWKLLGADGVAAPRGGGHLGAASLSCSLTV